MVGRAGVPRPVKLLAPPSPQRDELVRLARSVFWFENFNSSPMTMLAPGGGDSREIGMFGFPQGATQNVQVDEHHPSGGDGDLSLADVNGGGGEPGGISKWTSRLLTYPQSTKHIWLGWAGLAPARPPQVRICDASRGAGGLRVSRRNMAVFCERISVCSIFAMYSLGP